MRPADKGPRYIAREYPAGRRTVWRVFDNRNWSWPSMIAGRRVPASFPTEAEALAAARALNGAA